VPQCDLSASVDPPSNGYFVLEGAVMLTRLSAAAALVVVALIAVITPALSQATAPGKNGKIAFARFRFMNSPLRREIWIANPDGSGLRRMTTAGANYLDSNPGWAPDGSKLLFTICAPLHGSPCSGRSTIWSVNADGSNLHMLSKACHRTGTSRAAFTRCPDNGQAAYSPSANKIAYQLYTGVPGIGIANSNLRQAHSLFPFGHKPGAPEIGAIAWSPNGSQLAFAVNNDNGKRYKPVGGQAIYVISLRGSGLHRVTPWNLHVNGNGNLDWSPDGSNILFSTVTYQANADLTYGDIYTVHPNGSNLQRLTHFPADTAVQLGSYSPNGTQIVFATTNNATQSSGSDWPDVFVMHADGSHITPVTRTINYESVPQWGPAR
jgi:Tol biopolymer transport system component